MDEHSLNFNFGKADITLLQPGYSGKARVFDS